MFTKKFNIIGHNANTLPPECVGKNESGWKIKGKIHNDGYYLEWVNEFEAKHPKYGKVWGDFEKEVHADSKEGYKNFIENHPPKAWDYWEI